MADETNILDQLIGRVGDESLRSRIAREVELLRGSRRFGMVFDRHLPESVRLTNYKPRKGIRVTLRDESTTAIWTVLGFTDQSRTVAILDGEGGERPVGDLVVVREFGEPIYPGLRSVERIERGAADAPWHVVINGENFHALQALRSTHRGKVDLIYIDPPYNTGNEGWIYNDRYVDANDRAKSSKWLSFLERRLLIARDLLKSTGVIICAIGDDEHHRLRMLLDEVFGPGNFIANVTWEGVRKNDSRYVSNSADYMLIYAKSAENLQSMDIRWKESKPGVEEVLNAAEQAFEAAGGNTVDATGRFRAWWKSLPGTHPAKKTNGLSEYSHISETGRLFRPTPIISPNFRENLRYEVVAPSGRKYSPPTNGWSLSEQAMREAIDRGDILFGPNSLRKRTYLDGLTSQTVGPHFVLNRADASQELTRILGDKRFPFPKDHRVMMRWIKLAAPKDAVVLDFFGGSGTTTEAVMRLNAEDDGTRQAILVTNNEVAVKEAKAMRATEIHPGDPEWEARGVFEYACRPRISTVVTGKRPDGSKYSDGLAANVEFFNLIYLDPGKVRRGSEYEAVAPLMWLEGGAQGEQIDEIPDTDWALTESYGVLFSIDALKPFSAAVAKAATSSHVPRVVFIITDSTTEYQIAVEQLPVGIDTVQLYTDYLRNHNIDIDGRAR